MKDDNFQIPEIKLEEDTAMEMRSSVLEPVEIPQIKPKMTRKFSLKPLKHKKTLMSIGAGVLVVVVLLVLFLGLPLIRVYNDAKVLVASGQSIQAAVAAQNITQIKTELVGLRKSLSNLQGSVSSLSWTRIIPFAGNYWSDADAGIKAGLYGVDAAELAVVTVEPYADIIGFTGDPSKQSKSGEDTANDRLEFIIQTIGSIAPKLDEISKKATAADVELNKIDPNRYPEDFRGIKVREKLKKVLALSDEGTAAIRQSKPLLEMAPYFLGTESPRTYLLLFQNDKELRPTGGFLTAYSIMNVDKGKVHPVSSSDIYSLDAKYKPNIKAPEEFTSYIKGPYAISPYFFLRDMNWTPDFFESMNLFYTEASKAGLQKVDGIIAVDTQVVVNILDVLGQIGVSGFGNFSTQKDPRCECPQVIYELEDYADVEGPVVWSENTGEIVFAPKNYGKNRKAIVGPLMNSVLANALGQPKEKLPALFEAGWNSVTEKHVLFYMFDKKAQEAVESFNIAGRVKEYEGDYLSVVDANLGGRKSNLYVTNEVLQDITVARDGSVEKTLTITYKNPKEQDGWLNSVLPNWTRIYVPKGSQLISMDGFENKGNPTEELGKTVFSGGFKLRPQGVVKVTVKYKLPFKVSGDYKMLVQKQPGTNMPLYTINLGKQKEELFLKTDKEFKFRL